MEKFSLLKRCYPAVLCAGLLAGCQTVEQFSIDYMLPAKVSFPASLKRVGVVNNMPPIPDNQLIVDRPPREEGEFARRTNYYNGDGKITTEALADALADGNYFDQVVICDSALRAGDVIQRESILSAEEVDRLVSQLEVDFLIALENIQMRTIRRINYVEGLDAYDATLDVKVYPLVRVYVPRRSASMTAILSTDSIFWDATGLTMESANARLISDKQMITEASHFAGSVPVKDLLPHWKRGDRYYFAGGSVNMRDAAVYVRKGQWSDAVALWKKEYDTRKHPKQKMQAAYNLAFGYEMQDSITTAFRWIDQAQQLAYRVDDVEAKRQDGGTVEEWAVPDYAETVRYYLELKERNDGLMRLNVQMQRIKDEDDNL
ncbi:MAG: DUF6340 family protein [Prevotellaceae bacterium]|jgi:hypothetical protein|nr:DUF6340 family protein [Prevotellaceae bacterium]